MVEYISATEARKITEDALSGVRQRNLDEIFEGINSACKNGQGHIKFYFDENKGMKGNFDFLKSYLEEKGYTVFTAYEKQMEIYW